MPFDSPKVFISYSHKDKRWLARAVFFNRLGELRDRTYENQQHPASDQVTSAKKHRTGKNLGVLTEIPPIWFGSA